MSVSDAWRQRTVEELALQYARGNLSMRTLEHRLETALSTDSPSELHDLTWDLPAIGNHGPAQEVSETGFEPAASFTRLRFSDGFTSIAHVDLESWIVGRSRTADIWLDHPTVSRRHAVLSCRGGTWILRDLDSRNGTYVNGTRVHVCLLRAGDVVQFGAGPTATAE